MVGWLFVIIRGLGAVCLAFINLPCSKHPMETHDLRVLLLLDRKVGCFARTATLRWWRCSVLGEDWYPLTTRASLNDVLDDLSRREDRANGLQDFELNLLYTAPTLLQLSEVVPKLAELGCTRWQILRWEPLRDRAARLSGQAPTAALPPDDWLTQHLLPVLESSLERNTVAPPAKPGVELQSDEIAIKPLRAERRQLEAERAAIQAQMVAMQLPSMEQLISYLPAIYRNPFVSIAPHDLALLAGRLQLPSIASPWPEPSADTLLTLQTRLRRLPASESERLREFCRQLPHRLDLRPEMRAWLGEA